MQGIESNNTNVYHLRRGSGKDVAQQYG